MQLFSALDPMGSGRIGADNLLPLAMAAGFTEAGPERCGPWAEEYLAICHEHNCDPSRGLTFLGFCSMINKPLGGGQLWLPTQDLLSIAATLKVEARPQDFRAPAVGNGASGRAESLCKTAARSGEAISDSGSDFDDGEIAAALQRAHVSNSLPAPEEVLPVCAGPAQPPASCPDPDTADRLARYYDRGLRDTARQAIKNLRDTFNLPQTIVLALVLADPCISRYVCDGGSLFQKCLQPPLISRRWANLLDMLDPQARTTAETMLGTLSLRGLALHLIDF